MNECRTLGSQETHLTIGGGQHTRRQTTEDAPETEMQTPNTQQLA